ncbi:MAG TPA: ATP-dependent Clp protease proteolytic subunit [Acidimicrobiales bacterium]|nr:ATP-dependent Clp protease proteolytic subunit [Acidimicrobiales bacterium]
MDVTAWNDDLRSRLLERRTVLLSGVLDDASAGDLATQLMMLDATGDGTVHLQIDCVGQGLDAAFTVMDTIDLLGVPVHATCLGRVEGAAVGVLAVCHKRLAAAHARIRLRDPELGIEGSASEIARYVAQATKRLDSFHGRIAAACRRTTEEVATASAEGRFMSADEAKSFGLVDDIARRGATIHAWPGVGLGFRPPARRG